MRALRVLRILHAVGRFGLGEFLPGRGGRFVAFLLSASWFWRDRAAPRGERLRRALESLGPVFVKFGQLLSVRRDLIPEDLADELARLQDNVPPFPWEAVRETLARAYGKPHEQVFATFESVPIASASVAQVHFATLPDGREVAVKILRPGIAEVIARDVDLLYALATLVGTPAPAFHIDPIPLQGTAPQIPVALPSDVIERRPDAPRLRARD